jgi:hypothetical protein
LTELALIYIAQVVVRAWQKDTAGKIAAALVIAGIYFPGPYEALLALALLILLLDRAQTSPIPALFAIMAVVFYGFYTPPNMPPRLALAPVTLSLGSLLSNGGIVLCAGLFVGLRLAAAHERWLLAFRLTTFAVVLGVVIPWHHRAFQERLRAEPWVDVQLWARENTSPTAVFITPPEKTGFRVFSERPVVGEWKDGTQQYFNDAYSFEWWERMQALGMNDFEFFSYSEEQLLDIGARYGARYLVFPKDRALRFRKLYENSEYAVHHLELVAPPPETPQEDPQETGDKK